MADYIHVMANWYLWDSIDFTNSLICWKLSSRQISIVIILWGFTIVMKQFTISIPKHQLPVCALSFMHSCPEVAVTAWHPKHQVPKLQPDRCCGLRVRLFWCQDNSHHLASMTALYYHPTVITALIGSVKLQWLHWTASNKCYLRAVGYVLISFQKVP